MSAQNTIDKLRSLYAGDRFQFDCAVAQLLNGDAHKCMRQEIILLATGQARPISQCTTYAVSDALKNSFDQLTLF